MVSHRASRQGVGDQDRPSRGPSGGPPVPTTPSPLSLRLQVSWSTGTPTAHTRDPLWVVSGVSRRLRWFRGSSLSEREVHPKL